MKNKITNNYIPELDEEKVRETLQTNKFSQTINKPKLELKDKIWEFKDIKNTLIKDKIKGQKNLIYLDNTNYFEVKGGFQPPVDKTVSFEISLEEYSKLTDKEKNKVFSVVFDANDIKEYIITSHKRFWIIANDVDSEESLKKEYPHLFKILSKNLKRTSKLWWYFPNIRNFELIKKYEAKILSPRTANKPSFAIDKSRSVFKGTNTMIISKILSLEYVVAILNSKLSNFWYTNFGYDYHGGKTKKYEPDKVKNFSMPIIIPSKSEEELFKQFVNEISKLKELLFKSNINEDNKLKIEKEIGRIKDKINEETYKLYGVVDDKKIIEESSQ